MPLTHVGKGRKIMSFDSYFLQFNNGKKEKLNDARNGVRREQVDEKYHNLFDAYDLNQNNTLETHELEKIFTTLSSFAGSDGVLNSVENDLISSIFLGNNVAINSEIDFRGFVKSVGEASTEIESSTEKTAEDGGKTIITIYKDGTKETIGYYPDGSYKFKKTEKILAQTHYFVEVNGIKQEVTEEEYNKALAQIDRMSEQNNNLYQVEGRQLYYNPLSNIKVSSETLEEPEIKYDFSQKAYLDINARNFILSHYIETYQATKSGLDTMGLLDDIGAAINAGAGELWQDCVNLYNKWFGNGTQEEYQSFYELVEKFDSRYSKIDELETDFNWLKSGPERYFVNFETSIAPKTGNKYNMEEVVRFQSLTEQYQTATLLTSRIDILNKALKEIKNAQYAEYQVCSAPEDRSGVNQATYVKNAYEYLLAYFDNDEEVRYQGMDDVPTLRCKKG